MKELLKRWKVMSRPEYYLNKEQIMLLENASYPNWPKVFEYAKRMEQGVKFAPVKIHFNKKTNKWQYNDGRHRVLAAKMSGKPLLVRSKKIMGENNESRK